jgi:protein subunit release factor B
MPDPLVVVDEDPVVLEGAIDSGNALQLTHNPANLSSYNQTLHAYHANLDEPNGTMQIRLMDFAHGGASWQLTASHQAGTTVSWTRSTNHAHYTFTVMTDLLEVDVVATSNASPPQTKIRKVWIKTMPKDALPDHP